MRLRTDLHLGSWALVSCVAALLLVATVAPHARAAFADFGLKALSATESTTEAGAHPDVTVSFELNSDPNSAPDPTGLHDPYARLRGAVTELPPGLMGNPKAVPQCTVEEFSSFTIGGKGCPSESQVGIARLGIYHFGVRLHEPIYNLRPGNDNILARLGFYSGTLPFYITIRVRPNDYGLIGTIDGPPSTPVVKAETELWGVPADPSHDNQRLTAREAFPEGKAESPPRPSSLEPKPFMTNPTSCGGAQPLSMAVWSYQEPERISAISSSFPETTDCEDLEFEPTFSAEPTAHAAGSPTGLDATLSLRQNEGWSEKATSQLRDAVVTLPVGMTISPSAAQGLAACSSAEVHLDEDVAAACPDASEIGTAEIDVPVLARPLRGAVYQRTPEPGHLFRVWLVTDELGVHVKLQGEIAADPQTGQLTTVFRSNPQVPLRQLKLHFKGGAEGVLVTPSACGSYLSSYAFYPWAGGTAVQGQTPMAIDEGCDHGGFSPTLSAGSSSTAAGAFTPFVFRLDRSDGQENVASLDATLPAGLLAKLKGVEVCPENLAKRGSCSAASRIGTVEAAVGAGPNPLWVPQPGKAPTAAYLAGPYKGAPYSLLTLVPAQAGPFDLGTVLIRSGIYIDQTTAQVSVKSDPLPQILEGVPLRYRTLSVELDRPDFTLNPTDCNPMSIKGSATSSAGTVASLSNRFQVGGCGSLAFHPKLKLSLKGARKRAGDPALSATLRMPSGGTNIAWTRVTLPRSVQIDNAHINNPCTRVQFAANACPPNSILGRAKVLTPLLDHPLEGPVYFRSNGGERELPDLVADLNGQIHVVIVGFIDAKRSRIRATFASVPDAPITKFQMNMFGGKRGLLENNRDLCSSTNKAVLQFNGQNGKEADSRPAVLVHCPKTKRPTHHH